MLLPLLHSNRRSLQSIGLTFFIWVSSYVAQDPTLPPPVSPSNPLNYTSFNFTSLETDNNRSCSEHSLYCSPITTDNWKLNSKQLFLWNYQHPELVVSNIVDLRVYLIENPREPVFEKLGIQNRDGKYPFSFNSDSFYKFDSNPHVDKGYNYIKKQVYYTITPAGSQNPVPPQSANFSVIDTDPPGLPQSPTPSTTPTPTPTSSPSPTPTSEPSSTSLPPYSIALIVIASLTGLVTVATIIYVLLSRRNEAPPAVAASATAGQLEKGGGAPGVITTLDNGPDGSSKPSGATVISSRDSAQTQNSTTPLAPNTNLSSTDAQMLSETFRNMMRKPSWTTDQQYPSNLAKQRLEEELEREGVGLQDIQPKKLTIQTESTSPIQPPPPSRPPNP